MRAINSDLSNLRCLSISLRNIFIIPKSFEYSFLITGKVDEKATQLHAIASLKVLLDATKPQDGLNGTGSVGVPGVVDQAQDSGRASQGTEVMFSTLIAVSITLTFPHIKMTQKG